MRYLLVTWAIVANYSFANSTSASIGTVVYPMTDSSKIYHVRKLDGSGFDYATTGKSQWNQAEATDDFTYPWRTETPPLTVFRALYDDEYFYFLYQVTDTSLNVSTETGQETDVMNSDRVELFFLSKGAMNPYYCLEIDPHAQLFDYESRYYRKSNVPWSWPADQIEITALPYEGGYAIAGRVSLSSLRAMDAIQGSEMKVGLFRANVVGNNQDGPIFKWISWVKPDAAEPDFHIPSAFGTFVLQ